MLLTHFFSFRLILATAFEATRTETLYLFPNESVSLNSYNYFNGSNLNLISTSKDIQVSPYPILKKIYEVNFTKELNQSNLNFTLLSVGETEKDGIYFIAENRGSSLYLFLYNVTTNELEPKETISLGETIQEVYIWTYNNKTRLLVITKAEENYVYLISYANTSDIIRYEGWDIKYLEGLRSSETLTGRYIPFIGNLYSNYSVFFLYDFEDVENPELKFVYTSENFINAMSVSSNSFSGNLLEYYVLCQSSGILKVSHPIDSLSLNISTLKLKNFTFANMRTSFNSFYDVSVNSTVLLIGCSEGMLAIRTSDLNEMFFVKSNETLLSSFVFRSVHFMISSNKELVVVNDTGSERRVVYILNLSGIIEDFFKSEYYIGQWPDGNFIILLSNPSNLVIYNITMGLPDITIGMNNETFSGLVTDGNVSVQFVVNKMDDNSKIYYLSKNRIPDPSDLNLEVLFTGFTSNLDIDPNSILSGQNMIFEFNLTEFKNETFELRHESFDKLRFKSLSSNIEFQFTKILIAINAIYFIYPKRVEKRTLPFDSIKELFFSADNIIDAVINSNDEIIISYENNSINSVRINSSYSLTTDIPCETLQMMSTYLLCAQPARFKVYNLTAGIFDLVFSHTFPDTSQYIKDIEISVSTSYPLLFLFDMNLTMKYMVIGYPNLEILFFPGEGYKFMMSETNLFLFVDGGLKVYDFESHTKFYSLQSGHCKVLRLNNFLYCSLNDRLIILDTSRGVLNSYFFDVEIGPECNLSAVGFYSRQESLLIMTCTAKKLIKLYTCACPQYLNWNACVFKLPFSIHITNPKALSDGSYKRSFSVIGKNSYSSLSFNVNLNLIVYGQAVATLKTSSLYTDFHKIEYDTEEYTDLLDIFSGNNMQVQMFVNNSKNVSLSKSSPFTLTPRVKIEMVYEHSEKILSLTSLPLRQILLYTSINSYLALFNTTNSDIYSIDGFDTIPLNISSCPIIKFLFDIDSLVYLAEICIISQAYPQKYFNGQYYDISIASIPVLLIIAFDINKLSLLNHSIYHLNFMPSLIGVIYDGSTAANIYLVSKIIMHTNDNYLNNEIQVVRFEVQGNGTLAYKNSLTLNYRNLDLERFYATSVDGVRNDQLYLTVVDKYFGVRFWIIENGQAKTKAGIRSKSSDYFTSLSLTYKELNIVTSHAKIIVYNWNKEMELKYYVTRYPYTMEGTKIRSVPSLMTYEKFFFNQYLVFSVTYDYKLRYFRVIDNKSVFSSALITDINFNYPSEEIYSFQIEFLNENLSYFINNMNEIHRMTLSQPYFTKKVMSKGQYDQVIEDWGGNEFFIQLVADNKNNKDTSGVFSCKIQGYTEQSSDTTVNIWWIAVLVVGLFILLMICVVIIYKCIFKWKKKQNREKNLEMMITISSINSFFE